MDKISGWKRIIGFFITILGFIIKYFAIKYNNIIFNQLSEYIILLGLGINGIGVYFGIKKNIKNNGKY